MYDELKYAATEGLLIGVKWAVCLVVIGIALAALMGDYAVTRNNANFAASVIRESVQKAQQAPAASVPK